MTMETDGAWEKMGICEGVARISAAVVGVRLHRMIERGFNSITSLKVRDDLHPPRAIRDKKTKSVNSRQQRSGPTIDS